MHSPIHVSCNAIDGSHAKKHVRRLRACLQLGHARNVRTCFLQLGPNLLRDLSRLERIKHVFKSTRTSELVNNHMTPRQINLEIVRILLK